MLFERWRQIAQARSRELAMQDLPSGESWTFSQLSAAAEGGPPGGGGHKIVFPQGQGPEFVVSVLRAWRQSKIVCPVESGQRIPEQLGLLPTRIAHLKSTSATTGKSRLVAFTAEQLAADAQNIVNTMGLSADSPNLSLISIAHSYGFSNVVLPLLLHGIPVLFLGSTLPESLRRAGELQQELTLPAVPALWRVWQAAGAIPANVRLAISAGAPLPLAVEQGVYARFGLKIHNFFGSSECGGIAYDRTVTPRTDPALIGQPMDNVQLTMDPDGCLEIRGNAVGETYWPEPNRNLRDGVFRSGDLVDLRAGNVFFRGRACDRINVAGRKVLPDVIEKVITGHPGVQECLVFGVPAHETGRGETIVVCLVAASGLDLEALKGHVLRELPAWQVPRDWWRVDSLQPTARGKVSRAEWRQRYLARATNPAKGS